MRILHLLEPAAGDEAVIACREAMRVRGVEHRVWIVGDSAAESQAAKFGVVSTSRIVPLGGAAVRAHRRLRALAADRAAFRPDILQCWSVPMLGLARRAFGRRAIPRAACLLRPPLPADSGAARRQEAFALNDTTLLAFDESIRTAFAPAVSHHRGGVFHHDNIRMLPVDTPIAVRPPILVPGRRERVRQALGIPDDSFAIALLADPPSAGDAMRFVFMCGILYLSNIKVTALIRTGSSGARRAARFIADHSHRWGLVECDDLHELLTAADCAVWDAPAPAAAATLSTPSSGPLGTIASAGPVSIALAASMGVPLVCAPSTIPGQALGDIAAVCTARNAESRSLARAAIDLATDPALRLRRAGDVRQAAAAALERDVLGNALLELWREIANVPVPAPGLPLPTALVGASA